MSPAWRRGRFARFRRATHPKHRPRRRSTRYKATEPGSIEIRRIEAGDNQPKFELVIKLPRKIRSMNKLKSGIALHGDKVSWEKALAAVGAPSIDPTDLEVVSAYADFVHPACGRRRLSIERQAPSVRYLLDMTNCHGGAKKLEDVLVKAGYFVDDSLKWLDGPHIVQTVAADRKFWTIIRITDADPYIQQPPS